MIKIFVIGIIVIIGSLYFCISKIVFFKKTLYYRYVDKTKKITSFDYLMDYDGSWLFKEINFEKIIKENINDEKLLVLISKIKIFKKISMLLFIILIVFSIYMKIEKVV